MKNKFLSILAAGSLALMMQACGDDSSTSVDFDEETSSCSAADEDVKSSDSKENGSSDSKNVASSDDKKDAESSDSNEDGSSDSKTEGSSGSEENPDPEEPTIDLSKVSGFVMTSNYTTGAIRWFENGNLSESSITYGQDSKLVKANDKYIILNRVKGASTMAFLNMSSKAVEYQTNLFKDAIVENPQDVVFYNDEYWVTSESAVMSFIVDNGSLVPNSAIDLLAFSLDEGLDANVIDLEISHDTLFVLMQRYDENYSFPEPGLLALFKISYEPPNEAVYLDNEDALAVIELTTTNPSSMKIVNGDVYVGTHAGYNSASGTDADNKRGIEKVNLQAKTSTMYASGEKLGGGVIAMDVDYDNSVIYASIRGKSYGHGSVAMVELKTGNVKKIEGIDGSDGGFAYDSKTGILFVGARAINSYDENWNAVLEAPATIYAYDGKVVSKVKFADNATMDPYSIVF